MQQAFTVDVTDVKKFGSVLKSLSHNQLRFASKSTLNDVAFEARRQGQQWAQDNWTLRSKWVQSRMQVKKATATSQESWFGGRNAKRDNRGAEMLKSQHEGDHMMGKGKHGKSVPTNKARIGGNYNRNVRKPNKIREINRVKHIRGRGRQKLYAGASEAARKGYKFAFMQTAQGGEMYFLEKRDGRKPPKITTIHRQYAKGVKIKKTDWLTSSAKKAVSKAPMFARKNFKFEVARAKKRAG